MQHLLFLLIVSCDSTSLKSMTIHSSKVVGEDPLILVLYIDDLIITSRDRLIAECKIDIASEFEMKDIGLMHYYLGLEAWQESGHIFLG